MVPLHDILFCPSSLIHVVIRLYIPLPPFSLLLLSEPFIHLSACGCLNEAARISLRFLTFSRALALLQVLASISLAKAILAAVSGSVQVLVLVPVIVLFLFLS